MIGVYGGTFDPVHFGHLRPAVDVMIDLDLPELRLIPCGLPPHREPPLATAQQRLAMLSLSIRQQNGIVIDQRELQRDGCSYMIDTLNSLEQEFPEQSFCLIIGMDAFWQFTGWKNWREILDNFPLVVTHRPGYDLQNDSAEQLKDELQKYIELYQISDPKTFVSLTGPAVYFCPVTQLDISSTRIRELCAKQHSLHYLTPESVIAYIEQQGLYQ